MTGFDGEFALLQTVRAHLCVAPHSSQERRGALNGKQSNDKDSSLSQIDREYLAAVDAGYQRPMAYAMNLTV